QIQMLGTNNIRVRQLHLSGAQADHAQDASAEGLTYVDAQAIQSGVPDLRGVSPTRFVEGTVTRGNKESGAQVIGADERYDEVTNFKTTEGRFISELDNRDAKPVCVIGSEVRQELFGAADPIGRRIQIDGTWCTVVGLMETKAIRQGKTSLVRLRDINKD